MLLVLLIIPTMVKALVQEVCIVQNSIAMEKLYF